MAEQEIRFADGNITPVARIGGTVRRAAGRWTPAVHALLRHLEAAGFDGAPRVLGFDERGREVLTYIEGRTGRPSLRDCGSDGTLVEVARLVRCYHDAVATFQAPADADWQFQVGAPRAGEIICHNDLAPWNIVFAGGRPVALIDWDFAAPAPRLWDLAHALWSFTPLYADEGADEGFGPPEERARRMALFCDAYGLADRRGLLDTSGVGTGGSAEVRRTVAGWAWRRYPERPGVPPAPPCGTRSPDQQFVSTRHRINRSVQRSLRVKQETSPHGMEVATPIDMSARRTIGGTHRQWQAAIAEQSRGGTAS